MKTIEINLQKALQLYPSASGEFKALLESEFGKAALTQKITDHVKTFEDACSRLGLNSGMFLPGDSKDEIAYKKLKVIAKALNEGWQPDWTNSNQYKYYPWFDLSSGSGLPPTFAIPTIRLRVSARAFALKAKNWPYTRANSLLISTPIL